MDNITIILNNRKLSRTILNDFQNGNNPYVLPNTESKNFIGENTVFVCYYIYYNKINSQDIENLPYMRLVYRESRKGTVLEIRNSVRKWFLGKRSIHEINFNEFEVCLRHLSSIIFKEDNIIFNGILRQIEIGKTIKISNDLGTRVLFNTFSHKNYKKRVNYPLETLYFMTEDGKNNVKLYDKGLEMQKKNLFSPSFYREISKKWMLLRLEQKIYVSNNDFFRTNNIKTVGDFCSKKEIVIDYWVKQMTNLEYLELINEKELDFLKTSF